jgi:ribosomal protein L37AE/L43A
VSNTRRVKQPPRAPDETEAAFRDALRAGCPHCGSRRVTGRIRNGVWDYRLCCLPSCRTHAEPQLAHRLGAEAAERAAQVTGQKLAYRAIDSAGTRGAVVAGALAGG